MHRRNLRVDIDFLAKGLEEAGSLSVGKEVQLLLSPLCKLEVNVLCRV
jgi:hypothetical protein